MPKQTGAKAAKKQRKKKDTAARTSRAPKKPQDVRPNPYLVWGGEMARITGLQDKNLRRKK